LFVSFFSFSVTLTFLKTIIIYFPFHSDTEGEVSSRSLSARRRDTEDLLTKLVRLIAHLAISPTAGPVLARDDGITPLIALLERKATPGGQGSGSGGGSSGGGPDPREELVLNLVSCVTNLSFYHAADSHVLHAGKTLARLLAPLLLGSNPDAVTESARAFGNLSRDPEVREVMRRRRVDEMAVILLDHSDREVVFSVAGVVMNLAGDAAGRYVLFSFCLFVFVCLFVFPNFI
jgi:hypothetical protein